MECVKRREYFWILAFVGAYQLLQSFDTSSAFTVQIAGSVGISNKELYSEAQPFKSWCLLPATIIAGTLYQFCGYKATLVFLCFAVMIAQSCMLASVLLFQKTASDAWSLPLFKGSFSFYAFSFSCGFVVNCAMFSLVKPSLYQTASSLNSIMMMVGSLLSSFVGQWIAPHLPTPGYLMPIDTGVLVLCLALIVIGTIVGAMPKDPRLLRSKEMLKLVWKRFVLHHKNVNVVMWSAFSAITVAIHTLVKGMWKSLFHDINADIGIATNGYINAITSGSAALCMIAMSFFSKAVESKAAYSLFLFPLLCAGLFVGMTLCKSILVATVLLCVYNVLCECALVLGSTMMAKSAIAAEEVEHENEELLAMNDGDNETRDKRHKLVNFSLVFSFNAVVSILTQVIFNAVAVYVLDLSSRGWFYGFALVSVLLSVFVLILTIVHCIKRK